jgi:hypothetical protein
MLTFAIADLAADWSHNTPDQPYPGVLRQHRLEEKLYGDSALIRRKRHEQAQLDRLFAIQLRHAVSKLAHCLTGL